MIMWGDEKYPLLFLIGIEVKSIESGTIYVAPRPGGFADEAFSISHVKLRDAEQESPERAHQGIVQHANYRGRYELRVTIRLKQVHHGHFVVVAFSNLLFS